MSALTESHGAVKLMFSWGMLTFIGHIEGFGLRKKLALFSGAVVVAFGMGFY